MSPESFETSCRVCLISVFRKFVGVVMPSGQSDTLTWTGWASLFKYSSSTLRGISISAAVLADIVRMAVHLGLASLGGSGSCLGS